MSTKQRQKHNLDLPRIAKAIQEYKTTNKTQKQCADDADITVKLFSYYYLNGFKKSQKMDGGNFHSNDPGTNETVKEGGVPPNMKYEKKAKLRNNNYAEVVLMGEQPNTDNKHILPPQHAGTAPQQKLVYQQPVYQQPVYQPPVYQQPVYQPLLIKPAPADPVIKKQITAATTVLSNGIKKVDLGQILISQQH